MIFDANVRVVVTVFYDSVGGVGVIFDANIAEVGTIVGLI